MAAAKSSRSTKVVVRTYSAGVHFGTLVRRAGKEVELRNARRVWWWKGANTLHEVALRGVASGSKVSDPVTTIVLTEAIEVITCAPGGAKALEAAKWG